MGAAKIYEIPKQAFVDDALGQTETYNSFN
jgi:hypothetical protein